MGARFFPEPHVQIARSGLGRRELLVGARQIDVGTSPRMIEIYEAGYEIKHTRWFGDAGACVAISVPRSVAERLLRDEGRRFNLVSTHAVENPLISQLGLALADESCRGRPNGRLYSEGLSIALLGVLLKGFGSTARCPAVGEQGLSSRQREILLAFITEELASDLSIERMGSLLGLSAFQLSRRFKASFGVSPHRFVLDRRIHTAMLLLRSGKARSIAQIALEVGFSNQAHLTQAFRKHTGLTPGQVRFS